LIGPGSRLFEPKFFPGAVNREYFFALFVPFCGYSDLSLQGSTLKSISIRVPPVMKRSGDGSIAQQ
jgi:hypothetical protein